MSDRTQTAPAVQHDKIIIPDRAPEVVTPAGVTPPTANETLEVECPAWCTVAHSPNEAPDDTGHVSDITELPAALLPAIEAHGDLWPVDFIDVYLCQDVSEREPKVWIGKGQTSAGMHLLTWEARALAAKLTHLCDVAERGAA